MERDIHQTPVAVGPDLRQAGNGLWVQHPVSNEAQSTGPLGDQHGVIGKECDSPWMRKPPGHDTHANLVLLRRVNYPGSRSQRGYRYADRRLCRMAEGGGGEQQRRSPGIGMSDSHANLPRRDLAEKDSGSPAQHRVAEPARERFDPQQRVHVALPVGVLHRGEQMRLLELQALRVALEQRHVVLEDALGIGLRAACDGVADHRVQSVAAAQRLLHQVPALELGERRPRAARLVRASPARPRPRDRLPRARAPRARGGPRRSSAATPNRRAARSPASRPRARARARRRRRRPARTRRAPSRSLRATPRCRRRCRARAGSSARDA